MGLAVLISGPPAIDARDFVAPAPTSGASPGRQRPPEQALALTVSSGSAIAKTNDTAPLVNLNVAVVLGQEDRDPSKLGATQVGVEQVVSALPAWDHALAQHAIHAHVGEAEGAGGQAGDAWQPWRQRGGLAVYQREAAANRPALPHIFELA